MKVYVWTDRLESSTPRAVMQRGCCEADQCGQLSISISNGEVGMTVRFDSEDEFRRFVEHGEVTTLSDLREGRLTSGASSLESS